MTKGDILDQNMQRCRVLMTLLMQTFTEPLRGTSHATIANYDEFNLSDGI